MVRFGDEYTGGDFFFLNNERMLVEGSYVVSGL